MFAALVFSTFRIIGSIASPIHTSCVGLPDVISTLGPGSTIIDPLSVCGVPQPPTDVIV